MALTDRLRSIDFRSLVWLSIRIVRDHWFQIVVLGWLFGASLFGIHLWKEQQQHTKQFLRSIDGSGENHTDALQEVFKKLDSIESDIGYGAFTRLGTVSDDLDEISGDISALRFSVSILEQNFASLQRTISREQSSLSPTRSYSHQPQTATPNTPSPLPKHDKHLQWEK